MKTDEALLALALIEELFERGFMVSVVKVLSTFE